MLESILSYISSLDPLWIYITLFVFAFIENVFPPSPSDVVVIVGATLIANTSMGFIPILIISSMGSALGFILMYYVGKIFGERIIRSRKIKFIHREDIEKADRWFNKYGYYVITANRFLPGTRSIISFFSGVHELNVWKTFLYAAISAFAWNVLIIFFGMQVGHNIQTIDYYLSTYSNVIISISAVVIGYLIYRVHKRHKEQKQKKD